MKNGILLIDKKEGMTSREVDDLVKKRLGVRGCGHLGTLDPFATGLLIVGIGDGTKLFSLMDESRKTYVATLRLGSSTDSGDYTGSTIEKDGEISYSDEKIVDVLNSFLGRQTQVPPAYSAKHVGGRRAYELAREGKRVELPPQEIEIYGIRLVGHQGDSIVFECEVSKGTYIRTLGEDIARKLGTFGHLTALRRTRIGSYDVEDAHDIDSFDEDDVLPMDMSLSDSSYMFVHGDYVKNVANGMKLTFESDSRFLFPLNSIGRPLAIYEKESNVYVCQKGFNNASRKVDVFEIFDTGFKFESFKQERIAVAIGEFDGFHKGHMEVLDSLAMSKLPKYVVTFDDSFKTDIRGMAPSYLISTKDKIETIKALGYVDGIILIHGSKEIFSLKPIEFVEKILRPFNVRDIYVGEDFTYGYMGEGRPDDLKNLGLNVRISTLKTTNNKKISTTCLIELIKEGNLEELLKIAGHYYCFDGEVMHGFQQGRKLGFPTINMDIPKGKVMLPAGTYKTYSIIGGRIYHSMTNIGKHPTINETEVALIETHVLDGFDEDIYGNDVKIVFEKKIRDEKKFDGLEDLVNQLLIDRHECSKGFADLSIGEYPFI